MNISGIRLGWWPGKSEKRAAAVAAHLSLSPLSASAHPTEVCLRPSTDSIGGSDLLHIHHPDVHSSGSLKTWVKNSTNLNFVFIFNSKVFLSV